MAISDDPGKAAFLNRLSGILTADADCETNDRLKEQALAGIAAALTPEAKTVLRKQMTFSVKKRHSKKRVQALDKGGQIKSIETGDAAKYESLSKKDHRRVNVALSIIMGEAARLSQARDAQGKPLFSADEIRKEFFDPLVREGVMPENLVPDQHSSTQKLLDKGMKRYQQTLARQRAQEASELAKNQMAAAGGGGTVSALKGKAKVGVKGVQERVLSQVGFTTANEQKAAMKFAGAAFLAKSAVAMAQTTSMEAVQSVVALIPILDVAPEIPDPRKMLLEQIPPEVIEKVDLILYGKDDEEHPELFHQPGVLNVTEGAGHVVQAGKLAGTAVGTPVVTGVVDLVGAKTNYKENKAETAAVAYVMGVATQLKKALDPIDSAGAAAVIDAFFLAADVDLMARALAGDPPDAATVVRVLSEALANATKNCAPQGEEQTFTAIGQSMAKGFTAAVQPAALLKAYQKDKDAAVKLLQLGADAALEPVAGKSAGGNPQAVRFAAVLQDPAAQDDLRDKVAVLRNQAAFQDFEAEQREFDELEREVKEYQQQLSQVDRGGALLAKANPIDKMIYKLKRDRAVLEMAAGLASGLPGVGGALGDAAAEIGATFLEGVGPLLRAAGLTARLVCNIIQAAKRWTLWNTFRQELDRAKNAVSSLSPAIQGLYANKQEQIAYHTIEDALLVAQIAGEMTAAAGGFASLGGLSAPAALAIAQCGKAVSKTSKAAQYVNTAVYKGYDLVQLKLAWRLTKKAMSEPHNRRKGLTAQMKNPTLALVAIIWAGMEDGDPIARQVMNACGLSEATLDDPDASSDKVLQYFMALLHEDRKLLDAERAPAPWRPRALALTRASWLVVQQRGQKHAKPPLKAESASAVEAALAVVEKHLDYAKVADQAQRDTYGEELRQLTAALEAYSPISKEGRIHKEMQEVVGDYIGLVRDRELTLLARPAS